MMNHNTLSLACLVAGLTLASPAILAQTTQPAEPVEEENVTVKEAVQSEQTSEQAAPQVTYGDSEQAVAEPEQQPAAPVPEGTFIEQQADNHWLADNLEDLEVIGSDGERIAEIEDLLLDEQGQIQGAVLKSGGFMGIGGKEIAVDWQQITLSTSPDGERVAQMDLTQEQLEQGPEFQPREPSSDDQEGQSGQGERIAGTVSDVNPEQQSLTLDTDQGQVQFRLPNESLSQYQPGDQVVVYLQREGGSTATQVEPQEETEQAQMEAQEIEVEEPAESANPQ